MGDRHSRWLFCGKGVGDVKHSARTFQGSRVEVVSFHPKDNPSQIVRSPTGRRQPLKDFSHKWYTDREYKVVGAINLGFFVMAQPASLHLGLFARDSGFIDGVPNNGHEMWLNKDGELNIAQLNLRGVKGIGDNWTWGASQAYQLIAGGKIDIQGTNGFNTLEVTNRTAYGQDTQGNIIAACATKANGQKMAEIMLSLGCVKAVMGDGGGSSQMIVNGKQVFSSTRTLGTALLIFGKEDAVAPKPSEKPILIIDPGHGGKDPGGGSSIFWDPNGFYEKDMVLQMSLYQYERFKELGVPVALTRNNDVYLSPEDRTNIIKASGAKYCMSNHINATSNSNARGAETIHSVRASPTIATKLLDAIVACGMAIRRVFSKAQSDGRDWYFMHRLTGSVITIINEYGFATNEIDARMIVQNWKLYAESQVKAWCEILGYKYSPREVKSDPIPLPTPKETLRRLFVDGKQVGAYATEEYLLDSVKVALSNANEILIKVVK